MIKRKMILGAAFMLFVSICLWSSPGFSEMNIVVRDVVNPCKPYSKTAHNFGVIVFNCDFSLFTAMWLNGVGPGGGKIYGKVKVPEGSYLVVGVATCGNVWTNFAFVNACCGKEVCVNLIPRNFAQCIYELRPAIQLELREAKKGPYREALERAHEAIAELTSHLKYRVDISLDALKEAQTDKQLFEQIKKQEREH